MFRFRNLLLGFCVALSIITFQVMIGVTGIAGKKSVTQAATPDSPLGRQAETLTQLGHRQLAQGQPNQALASWQEAAKIYQKLHFKEGVTGSLINQNLALQDIGLNLQACSTVLESLKLNAEGWICDSSFYQSPEEPLKALALTIAHLEPVPVNIIALQNLGDILRLLGKSDESELVLQQALNQANWLNNHEEINAILLSLANTERFTFEQLREKYPDLENPIEQDNTLKLIQQKARSSLYIYQRLNQPDVSASIRLKSQLSYLKLLLDAERWSATPNTPSYKKLAVFHAQIQNQIYPLAKIIQQNPSVFRQLPANESVLAQLNFATSLDRIPNEQLQTVAIHYADDALQTAARLNSLRLQSNSFGVLGNLYKQENRSQFYFEKAASLAQLVQASDLAWQWQQQLGILYQRQGQYDKAIQAYKAAIDNLDQVRSNLLSINSDVQVSFREKVEPVYRQYMRLLLSAPHPDLEQVIKVNEQLQSAELENYLQCGKLDLISLGDIQNVATPSAAIHIIDLGDQVEVIVRSTDRSLHRHTVTANLVKDNTDNLLTTLQTRRVNDYRDYRAKQDEEVIISFSQTLYNLLIAPVKKYLPNSGTLVFVLDSYFQGIPMSILHDGHDYLIKNYSISLTLGSRLRQPKALGKGQLRALIAGLSQKSPSFKDPNAPRGLTSLPEVEDEVEDIKRYTFDDKELLNKEFTAKRFEQAFDASSFPLVHITTHGQFSSNPKKTVILAWDQAVNIKQFNNLIRGKTLGEQDAIELLVLSACETAKGDKRSALGIAGVAAQAGARSTVASLWVVDTESTALLMGEFYKGLSHGLSKAEALRQAQLALLSNPKYRFSYFWAPFILVGSWL